MQDAQVEVRGGREDAVDSCHGRVVGVGDGVEPHLGRVFIDGVGVVDYGEGREIFEDVGPG